MGHRPQTGTTTADQAALTAARSGHLSIALGDNAILSRHDLLDLLQTSPFSAAAANGAASLTHFSRTVNAPSWLPLASAGSTYTANKESSSSANRNLPNVRFATPVSPATSTITHYYDDGTTGIYTSQVGAPLATSFFPGQARMDNLRRPKCRSIYDGSPL